MFVRQKIDQLGEERSAGQVKDRNLGLILGGSIEGGRPRRDTVQDWIALSEHLWAAGATRSSRKAGRLLCSSSQEMGCLEPAGRSMDGDVL